MRFSQLCRLPFLFPDLIVQLVVQGDFAASILLSLLHLLLHIGVEGQSGVSFAFQELHL